MSSLPQSPPETRHALGLPAGSVRALLAFCVLAYLWILVLVPNLFRDQPETRTTFLYMQLVMLLAVSNFVTAHGKSIGSRVSRGSPLHMPRGSVRLILLAGYFGMVVYMYLYRLEAGFFDQVDIKPVFVVLAVILAAYLIGHVSTTVMRFLGGGALPYWFQDVQAWFGLISLVLLAWVIIARLVINPTVSESTQLTLAYTEPAMAAFVAYYFGARA